jgi:hypothetical protein
MVALQLKETMVAAPARPAVERNVMDKPNHGKRINDSRKQM